MAVVLAVVLPSLTGERAVELRSAAHELAGGLRAARSRALARQEPTTLTLDVEARRFAISGLQETRSLPASVKLSLYTARAELVNSERGAIRFYPDGSSTGGRVTLSLPRQPDYLVDVDWLTGRVRVRQAPAEAG